MVAEGSLMRAGPSRASVYYPSPDQAHIINGIWARLKPTKEQKWDRTWLMLALQLPVERRVRDWIRRALWFDGFRPLTSCTYIRPAWPQPWAEARARYFAQRATGVCVRGELTASSQALTHLYDLDEFDREGRELAAWIRRKARRIPTPATAWQLRINVGSAVAQFIGHDPRLPPAVWGSRKGLLEIINAFAQFERAVAPQAEAFLDKVLAK